eukprot:12309463-Alexandrium_andersonii.AAC.1
MASPLTIPRLCNKSGRNSCRMRYAGSSSGEANPNNVPFPGTQGSPPGGMAGPGSWNHSHTLNRGTGGRAAAAGGG